MAWHALQSNSLCSSTHFTPQHTQLLDTLSSLTHYTPWNKFTSWNTLLPRTCCFLKHLFDSLFQCLFICLFVLLEDSESKLKLQTLQRSIPFRDEASPPRTCLLISKWVLFIRKVHGYYLLQQYMVIIYQCDLSGGVLRT